MNKKISIIEPTLIEVDDLKKELNEIFKSKQVSSSKYVKQFENRCAQFLGVKHAICVSNATSGLMLAVKGLKITGEVIVPSFTFTATCHSLVWNNIKPVFVDCEKGSYNIDPKKIEEKITSKTTAILPVYIFGNPPKINEIMKIASKHNLKVVFDSAQAFGSVYKGKNVGCFGNCEVFSLSPTKVLTAIEGGIITTNDDELAYFFKYGRDYGKSTNGDDIDFIGLSARMSEIHALIGLKNLNIFEKSMNNRLRLIKLYKKLLMNLPGISFQIISEDCKTSGNYMVIFIDKNKFGMSRNELFDLLSKRNIQTKKYFHPAIHLQKAYIDLGLKKQNLPITEKASNEGLALPLYGHMQEDVVKYVCDQIIKVFG